MGLGALADVVAPERVVGVPAGDVIGLTAHSAEVEPGSVFFAIPGGTHDGWTFVPEAASRGAVAVVAVVGLAFLLGRRRGKKETTYVEIRRV